MNTQWWVYIDKNNNAKIEIAEVCTSIILPEYMKGSEYISEGPFENFTQAKDWVKILIRKQQKQLIEAKDYITKLKKHETRLVE